MAKLRCPYCGERTKFVDSSVIYGQSYGMIYLCEPCNAYVGCHKKTGKPLGTPANAATRQWRKRAHAVFDPLWQRKMRLHSISKHEARSAGYKWLAMKLGIPLKQCHIAMFGDEMCAKVVAVCQPYSSKGGE